MFHFITSQLFASHQIKGIFSERRGGVSPAPFDSLNLGLGLGDDTQHVVQNLKYLCQQAQLPIPHRCHQTHGIDDLLCHGKGMQHQNKADILITSESGAALAIRTADCLPILLVDPQAGIAAAVHAGWRGTAKNIVQKAVHHMQQLGACPEHILASLGPCIAPCCFEVDINTAKKLALAHPESASCILREQQKYYPDLQAMNVLQLQSAAILRHNIEVIPLCTSCLSEHFFSHRRDGTQSGRQLAIVALPS